MTTGRNCPSRFFEPTIGPLGALLPAGAIAVESPGNGPPPPLLPEESQALGHAVPHRRREFAFARACARAALDRLGVPPQPVLPGPCREPCWPAGVVGSITHCTGYLAAAVARRDVLPALGIDAELHAPLPHGVAEIVMTADDRELLPRDGAAHWDCVLFSAKESAFKTWFGLTASWLDPAGATVRLDPQARRFSVAVVPAPGLPAGAPMLFAGRFAIAGGLVLTVALPACAQRAATPPRTATGPTAATSAKLSVRPPSRGTGSPSH